jgi:uncharacterized protein
MAMTPDAPEKPSVPPMSDGTKNHDALQMSGVSSTLPAAGSLAEKPALIAPWWHTAIIVILILTNSFASSSKVSAAASSDSRILLYGSTFITQLVLIVIVWFGIRSRGIRMRDLVGGRWDTVEKVLLDVAIAAGVWIIASGVQVGMRIALGTLDLHNLEKTKNETVRMLSPIAPHTYLEAGLFVLLSVCAGLFEEIIFRGYLQRQFVAISKNAAVGIALSALIFGLAHGYQGARMMAVIAVYGSLFGILAHLIKNLRPGMIAHAFQDSLSGIGLFFLVRH